MASTHVRLTSLEEATRYFEAGLLYWWSTILDDWVPLRYMSSHAPPTQREVDERWWGILVEDDTV